MRQRTVAGAFVLLSFASARAHAQMVGAPVDMPLAARQNVAPSPFVAMISLEGPGSDIGIVVRKPRADEGITGSLQHALIVESVAKDGSAARAGVKVGDLIFFPAYDTGVDEMKQFERFIHDAPPGRVLRLVVVRDGAQITVELIPELSRANAGAQP
jgi:S1-C subfamily serine protease